MSFLVAQNVTKIYGQGETATAALRELNLTIDAGEFVAIMGESGAGKSTLLSVLGAMNAPTSGQLLVDGIDVYRLDHERRAMFRREFLGFVFQSFHLIPYLTAVENVMLPLTTAPLKEDFKLTRAMEALARVRLAEKRQSLPHQLSGGEKERVAVARALVNKPPILLADEPTGNLDSRNTREMMKLLQQLHHHGMTIIMVTHSAECAQYAQRILRVADGRLLEEKTVALQAVPAITLGQIQMRTSAPPPRTNAKQDLRRPRPTLPSIRGGRQQKTFSPPLIEERVGCVSPAKNIPLASPTTTKEMNEGNVVSAQKPVTQNEQQRSSTSKCPLSSNGGAMKKYLIIIMIAVATVVYFGLADVMFKPGQHDLTDNVTIQASSLTPAMLALHVVSDLLIVISYFSIPFTLVYFMQKRKDLPFSWIFALFGAFIVACALTHFMNVVTLWAPAYLLAGIIKGFTAIVSVGTALALFPIMPKAIALPSPAKIEAAKREMERQIKLVAGYLEQLANGDIPEAITEEFNGDFQAIKQNLNVLITAMKDTVGVAEGISKGNLTLTVQERSERDRLMHALDTMIQAMQKVTLMAQEMAEGNLLVELNARSDHDTLMQALDAMIRHIKEIVVEVKHAANKVSRLSHEMKSSILKMAEGATEQAAAAEEASASMEQMVTNIRQNADNALQTEKIAIQAAQSAQESSKVVAEVVVIIQEIASKISIVQDIASQTRMLSLNATIEAAKAQEQGKGFAVVAAAVRSLAELTQGAATEINQLANSSVAIVSKAGEALAQLVPNIQKTAELVQEISAASREQDIGAGQINRAIQQLDMVIQQNTSGAETMAVRAEVLASQAEQLQEVIDFFIVERRKQIRHKRNRSRRKRSRRSDAYSIQPETRREQKEDNRFEKEGSRERQENTRRAGDDVQNKRNRRRRRQEERQSGNIQPQTERKQQQEKHDRFGKEGSSERQENTQRAGDDLMESKKNRRRRRKQEERQSGNVQPQTEREQKEEDDRLDNEFERY